MRGVRHEPRPWHPSRPLLGAPTDRVQPPVPGPDVVTPALGAAQRGDVAAHIDKPLERGFRLPDREGVAGAQPLDHEGTADEPWGSVEIRAHGLQRQIHGDEAPDVAEPETRYDTDHRASTPPSPQSWPARPTCPNPALSHPP